MTTDPEYPLHGLMAQFATAPEILEATRRAWQAGYREMDAYTPYSVDGLAVALGMKTSRIPSVVFCGGLVGAGAGFFMQFYSMGIDYPLNAGGRPYNSWPIFIPITFELLVLVAALSAFVGLLYLNGLPRPHHPVFNVPDFVRASQDRFFLCIEAVDPKFDRDATAQFLLGLSPEGSVIEVPREQLIEPADIFIASASEPVGAGQADTL
ncbi:MAG TPA: DUF3341 domain-containing protein [Pirellulales bacterium]|jgi:hypothetical protein|nr:DUF3341 domain-containing protein [Pirellulales bacterium]